MSGANARRMRLAAQLSGIHAEAFDAPWDAASFEALLAQAGVFAVARTDGFILVRAVCDEAEILTLAVRPAARGRGLAAGLLQEAVAAATDSGATRLFLEVAEDNVAALALYARAGFIEVGRRPAYYGRSDGRRDDALILARTPGERLP